MRTLPVRVVTKSDAGGKRTSPAITIVGIVVVLLLNAGAAPRHNGAGWLLNDCPTAEGPPATAALVDASRDGGVWWFPQSGPFEPAADHQGKRLADYVRSLGYCVTELPRGSGITAALLAEYELVVRANEFGPYTESELAAYEEFVHAGGRLLLLSDFKRPGESDALGAVFGLDIRGTTVGSQAMRFVQSPITHATDRAAYGVGSGVLEYPSSATIVGWLTDDTFLDLDGDRAQGLGEPSGPAAMGWMLYGEGRIVFAGDTNMLQGVPQPLTGTVIAWLAGAAPETAPEPPDQMRTLTGTQTATSAPTGATTPTATSTPAGRPTARSLVEEPTPPTLIKPPEGATILQNDADSGCPPHASGGYGFMIIFEWMPVSGVTAYDLYVKNQTARFPIVERRVSSSSFSEIRCGFVIDGNLEGWEWRVRSVASSGLVGEWSPTSSFRFAPCRLDSAVPCSAPAPTATPTPTSALDEGASRDVSLIVPAIDEFVGRWINLDPETRGITVVQIARAGDRLSLETWGRCHPADCYHGTYSVQYGGNPVTLRRDFSFVIETVTITLTAEGPLMLELDNVFTDGSGRNYSAAYWFTPE